MSIYHTDIVFLRSLYRRARAPSNVGARDNRATIVLTTRNGSSEDDPGPEIFSLSRDTDSAARLPRGVGGGGGERGLKGDERRAARRSIDAKTFIVGETHRGVYKAVRRRAQERERDTKCIRGKCTPPSRSPPPVGKPTAPRSYPSRVAPLRVDIARANVHASAHGKRGETDAFLRAAREGEIPSR